MYGYDWMLVEHTSHNTGMALVLAQLFIPLGNNKLHDK